VSENSSKDQILGW